MNLKHWRNCIFGGWEKLPNCWKESKLSQMQPPLVDYRDKQLLRLREEVLDLEDFSESVALNEFTLDDFRIELSKYIEAMFLSYAWNNDSCFPGQERLAQDMGMSRSRVTEFIGDLEKFGFISIQRRGQGKTNIYTIHFQVKSKLPDVGRPTSRSR